MVLALAAAACSLDTLLAPQGWPRHEQLRRECRLLRQQNDATEAALVQLRRRIAAIDERRLVQEQWVRHTLGYVRDGDVMVYLHAQPDVTAPAPRRRLLAPMLAGPAATD